MIFVDLVLMMIFVKEVNFYYRKEVFLGYVYVYLDDWIIKLVVFQFRVRIINGNVIFVFIIYCEVYLFV